MNKLIFKIWSKPGNSFLTGEFFDSLEVDSLPEGAFALAGSNYEFFKYAGFQDSKGQMVFEGDIVKYKSWSKVNEKAQKNEEVVEFKNGEFYPRPIEEFDVEFGGFSFRIYDIRVIGNIKESPELAPE